MQQLCSSAQEHKPDSGGSGQPLSSPGPDGCSPADYVILSKQSDSSAEEMVC